ncbi:hypothetical protein ACI79P_18540 [Blastococcus sp. SYSU DS0510]
MTGAVAVFTLVEVEEEFGLDLTDDLYVDYETELAVVSEDTQVTEGD